MALNLCKKLQYQVHPDWEVSGSYNAKETDSFYPLFKEFLKAPNKIIWIPQGDRIALELKSMGVKKENMKKIYKK